VEQGVAVGNIIHKVNPEYPRAAKAKHIQGEVVMKMTITVKGDVENLHVVQGDPLLAEAALDAVKKWKYKPFMLNGQPVPIDTVVRINFHL
jgi:protein TonB